MRFPCSPVPRIPHPRVTHLGWVAPRSARNCPCPGSRFPLRFPLGQPQVGAQPGPQVRQRQVRRQQESLRGCHGRRGTGLETWGASLVLGLLTWGGMALPSLGQTAPGSALPACPPPAPGEYLLLVLTPDAASQETLRQSLPPSVSVPACDYLGNTVSRMGGFRQPEDANAWADYIKEVASLQSFVARPPSTTPTAPPNPPNPDPGPGPRTFSPRTLGPGYAVLVDYGNDPGVAQRLRQARQQVPGLVSFGQRPYLITFQSADSNQVTALLADLHRQGFKALVVDSQGVVVLADQVQGLP